MSLILLFCYGSEHKKCTHSKSERKYVKFVDPSIRRKTLHDTTVFATKTKSYATSLPICYIRNHIVLSNRVNFHKDQTFMSTEEMRSLRNVTCIS